jgi:uncharacterized protein (TIGR03435 family)
MLSPPAGVRATNIFKRSKTWGNLKGGPPANLPIHLPANMLKVMHALHLLISFALLGSVALGQAATTPPTFDVASVRPSQHLVGPDYNNQITYSPAGMTGRNVTLKRLVAEAYHLQLNQVLGPNWLDQNEYDIDARAAGASTKEQMATMLRSLVAERFNLTEHSEVREMQVYELVIGKSGSKIRLGHDGEAARGTAGFHFHGDMRQFADLLAVQFSIPAAEDPSQPARAGGTPIPVVDKTGLAGTYDFSVDLHLELGTDMFALWQRALQDQLGLRIESRKGSVAVLVVDGAAKIPTAN